MGHRQHKSYLLIDNRVAGLGLEEYDLVSCKHCQRQVKIVRGQHQGHFCMNCFGPLCERPECTLQCTPWVRQVEASLRRAAFAQSCGLQEG